MTKPPCWPEGQPCPNWCADERYQRTVHNHLTLSGPWAGWRLAGRDLVSPDGTRMSPERVRGLAWRQESEARRDAARTRNAARKSGQHEMVRVVVVRLSEWRADRLGQLSA